MKSEIDVLDRTEARLLRAGLSEPDVRAFVKICGILRRIPSDRARRRILHFIGDEIAEANELVRDEEK